MKQRVSQNERATIYGVAFRRYLATGSSDYAFRGAAEEGVKLDVSSLRVDEIARDAVDDANKLQRQYAYTLLLEADERVLEYCEKFRDRDNQIQNFAIKYSDPLSEIPREEESKREIVHKGLDSLDSIILFAARLKREMKFASFENWDDFKEFFAGIDGSLRTLQNAISSFKTVKLSEK